MHGFGFGHSNWFMEIEGRRRRRQLLREGKFCSSLTKRCELCLGGVILKIHNVPKTIMHLNRRPIVGSRLVPAVPYSCAVPTESFKMALFKVDAFARTIECL